MFQASKVYKNVLYMLLYTLLLTQFVEYLIKVYFVYLIKLVKM